VSLTEFYTICRRQGLRPLAGLGAVATLLFLLEPGAAGPPQVGRWPGAILTGLVLAGLLSGAIFLGGATIATDAGGNTLLSINGTSITTLAAFPSRGTGRNTDSVPTSVARGPDGTLYVGELTGVPCVAGTANVYRVGKTPLSGVAFIVDVFAQKIVAWNTATVRDADLVMTPLKVAIWQRDREGHPIVHGELIGRDCPESLGVDVDPTAAAALGRVHRAVGLLQQGLAAVGVADGDPHARRDLHLVAEDVERPAHGDPDALGHVRDAIYDAVGASTLLDPLGEVLLMPANADRPSVRRVAHVSLFHPALLQSTPNVAFAAWNKL